MLITGTLNTLMTKIQFTVWSIGINGERELFQKPWFATLDMMFAMGLVGVIDKLVRMSSRNGLAPDKAAPLMEESPKLSNGNRELSYAKKAMLVSIPAAFDIAATALCAVGMLYIPASVWQMLRGSSILFAAVFSVLFLKGRLMCFNLLGLSLCIVGVTLVGTANVLGDTIAGRDPGRMIIGMSLVILGQVVQAAQVIAEEFLMKQVDLPGLQVVGLEGFWGTLMMLFIVYPVLYLLPGQDNGHLEDPFDTATLILNSRTLGMVVLVFIFSCGTFNATGIAVTAHLSGVHRMMLDASRTLLIWAFGLGVHYYINPESPFGEVWTPYSFLQLFGFTVLVTGQGIYGEVLKVPGLKYPPRAAAAPLASPAAMLYTPLPRRDE